MWACKVIVSLHKTWNIPVKLYGLISRYLYVLFEAWMDKYSWKVLQISSAEEKKSSRFGTTLWVTDDRNCIFGRTIPLMTYCLREHLKDLFLSLTNTNTYIHQTTSFASYICLIHAWILRICKHHHFLEKHLLFLPSLFFSYQNRHH